MVAVFLSGLVIGISVGVIVSMTIARRWYLKDKHSIAPIGWDR